MRTFGFGKWLGKKISKAVSNDKEAPSQPTGGSSPAGEGNAMPEDVSPQEQPINAQPAAQEEAPVAPQDTPTPVNPQTGFEQREVSAKDLDDSIYETGAEGDLGELEAQNLSGRDGPRRNINLDFFNDDSTLRTIEYFNRKMDGYQDNPARRPVSHEETIEKSAASTDPEVAKAALDRILNGSLDDKWSPEDLVSIYTMVDSQAKELNLYAKELKAIRASGGEASTEELAHYQLLSTRFVATQEIASTRAAEAGRMLNSLQSISKATSREYLAEMSGMVKQAGGPETLWKNIETVAEGNGIDDIANRARQTRAQKVWNMAVQLRYNLMLSSVRTHVANISGSVMTGVWESAVVNPVKIMMSNVIDPIGKSMLNMAVGATGSKFRFKPADKIALSEAVSLPKAMIGSVRAGFRSAKAVATGAEMGHGKVYNELGMRNEDPDVVGGGGLWGPLNAPTRSLEAEDAFFKTTYGHAQLEILAKRRAISEGNTPKEIDSKYTYYKKNPTEEMIDAANEFAAKLTFTNDPSIYGNFLGTLAKSAEAFQSHPMGRIVLPFVRTPVNIVGYTLEQTGMGKVVEANQLFKDLNNPEKAADAEARLAIAGGLLYYLEDLWADGSITGDSPENYGELRAREAAGWKPNSMKIGDTYYELNRADPMGLIVNAYATYFDAKAQMTEGDAATAGSAAILGVATMITDRSMLASLGDVERMFQASESTVGRQVGKFGARMATSFVIPAMLRDLREAKDPYKRSMDVPTTVGAGTWQAMRKTIMNAAPHFSEQLPPQVDAFGEDKMSTAGTIWRGMVPIRTGVLKQDIVTAALIATRVPVNKPDSLIKIPELPNAPMIDLLEIDGGAGWVYRAYQQDVGKLRHKMLGKLVNSAPFKKLIDGDLVNPDSVAADLLRKVNAEARRLATIEFIVKKLAGKKGVQPKVGGENIGDPLVFSHRFNVEEYKQFTRMLSNQGPTDDVMEKIHGAGMKYRHKPALQGLPNELRLDKQKTMPRFFK